MSQAGLVDIEASHPQIPTQIDTDSGSAIPVANVLNVQGSTVANATYAKPIFITGSGNTVTSNAQVSVARTGAPGDKLDAGLCSFDDTSFSVDADGYVTLAGGSGPTIDTNTGDDGIGVTPDGAGNFNWLGNTVANATHAKPAYFKDSSTANAIDLDIQVGAAITGAPGDKNDAGLSSYDDTIFTVDADGYVSLSTTGVATTITGDTGGALSPVANNWNILGGPGVTTSGSGATLTINSVVYTDQTATTLTSDSGTYATAAGAYTLPASPANGELVEIVCITTGIVVTANTGQEIQIGGDVTSTAGTATNSAKGDALVLRYRSTDTAWYAISSMGVWVLA